MPLILKKQFGESSNIALWEIREGLSYFLDRLELFPEEEEILDVLGARKKLEWSASRYLLKLLIASPLSIRCLYDPFGKPYLVGINIQISISHSHDMTAVACSKQKVGVDVQKMTEKINRIRHKFLTPDELEFVSPESEIPNLTVLWGAKEALYKAYGKKGLTFRQHLRIAPFKYEKSGGAFTAMLIKPPVSQKYQLYYSSHSDYMLVYGEIL